MFQPTRPLSALLSAVLRTTPHATTSTSLSRHMLSAAVVGHPHTPSFNLPILDIFDAPSRLGESSRLLVLNAAAASSRPVRSLSTQASRRRPTVKPLPAPTLLDGPARPRGMAYISFRAHRPRPVHPSSTDASGVTSRILPAPLPPPLLFDGPSELRPYVRGARRSSDTSSSLARTATPLVVAIATAVVLFGIDVEPQSRTHGQRTGPSHEA
ncbi:hypothetical protein K466DRAFT_591004 [Polyporus arcularius HHB13444]|uniref:Uncharacterized protein n=1 Tax=Polyporus arcularius HHB13444 TaxID=1314778 RepID=A0A5C3NX14_9APHY|nr:hypothetical protein K466DRAFT_591004 [Polyporus arcularius HHB13444]